MYFNHITEGDMCELCHILHIPICILDRRFSRPPYHMPDSLYFYNDYIFIEAIYLYSLASYPPPFPDFLHQTKVNILTNNTGVRCIEISPEDILKYSGNYVVEHKPEFSVVQIDSYVIKFIKDKNTIKQIHSDKLLYDYNDERNKLFRK